MFTEKFLFIDLFYLGRGKNSTAANQLKQNKTSNAFHIWTCFGTLFHRLHTYIHKHKIRNVNDLQEVDKI